MKCRKCDTETEDGVCIDCWNKFIDEIYKDLKEMKLILHGAKKDSNLELVASGLTYDEALKKSKEVSELGDEVRIDFDAKIDKPLYDIYKRKRDKDLVDSIGDVLDKD